MNSVPVAQLACGDEQASAFFVSRSIAVTAKHCVMPHLMDESVAIELRLLDGRTFRASISATRIPEPEDVVFLDVSEAVRDEDVLDAVVTHLPTGTEWSCSGFPAAFEGHPTEFSGLIGKTQLVDYSPWDIELILSAASLSDYSGLSGSPILVNGSVVGVVLRQVQQTLVGASLVKLRRFLELASVSFQSSQNSAPVPLWLQPSLKNFVPNSRAAWALEEAILETKVGVIVVEGLPGAGKSSLAATFEPTKGSIMVLGRYFVSGDPSYPPQHFAQPRVFGEWLSVLASLHTERATASSPRRSTSDLVVANLSALSEYCSERNLSGVLVVDGVEELSSTAGQQTILQTLPQILPKNILIVVTSSRPALKELLQGIGIRHALVNIPSLLQYECEILADKINPNLTNSQLVALVRESLGHPLLLTLLLLEGPGELEQSGSSLPNGIEDYYKRVFARLRGNSLAVWLLATLARTRQLIPVIDLIKLFPKDQRHLFDVTLNEIRHLAVQEGEGLKLYHSSLIHFVLEETASIHLSIHEALAEFCRAHPKSDYARTNIVHHHLRASLFEQALALADQSTFDSAGFIFAPPELMLGDVDELISYVVAEGNFTRLLSLLLLRSRIRFRYDRLFAESRFELAELAARVGKPERALDFVFRQNQYSCSPGECAPLARNLISAGALDAASQLFRFIRPTFWSAYEDQEGIPETVLANHLEVASLLAPLNEDFELDRRRLVGFLRDLVQESPELQQVLIPIWGRYHGQLLWMLGGHPFADAWRNSSKQTFASECLLAISYYDHLCQTHGPANGIGMQHASSDFKPLGDLCQMLVESLPDGQALRKIFVAAAPVLLGHAARTDWTNLIPTTDIPKITITIRQANGVDPDVEALERAFLDNQVSAYSSGEHKVFNSSYSARHDWEFSIIEATKEIGKLSGAQFRDRANGLTTSAGFETLVSEILERFRFLLAERVKWEEAYFLPEFCVPVVFRKCAQFTAEFFPDKAEELVDCLEEKFGSQLGLYSEGYIGALEAMAEEFGANSATTPSARRLWALAFTFIQECVFSRKERVAALVSCARNSARLKDKALTREAFSEALLSSLGPDWYKESQFSLLIDSLAVRPLGTSSGIDWKEAVKMLELASGECTFQRYVRYDKVTLVQKLALAGAWPAAVGLTLHYLLANPSIQRARLNRTPNDRISPWATGRFGVGEVEEQAVLTELVEGFPQELGRLRWALLELAIPLDERHLQRLGIEADKLLTGTHRVEFEQRFIRLLRMDVAPDRRQGVCMLLVEKLDRKSHLHKVLESAGRLGILVWPIVEEPPETPIGEPKLPDEFSFPGTFGKASSYNELKAATEKASVYLRRRQTSLARETLVRGLVDCQQGGWPVWEAGGTAKAAITLLFSAGNLAESTQALKPLIENQEHSFDWKVASTLIECASAHANDEERDSFAETLMAHLSLVVGPERKHIPVSSEELEVRLPSTTSASSCLHCFLVTLLEHPDEYFRARTADVLRWLAQSDEFPLEVLETRAVDFVGGDHGRETAAAVLKSLRGNIKSSPAADEKISLVSQALGLPPAKLVQPDVLFERCQDYEWSLQLPREIRDEPALLETAERHLTALCFPYSPTEASEIYKLRNSAFSVGYSSVEGTAQEREAIFMTVGELSAESQRGVVERYATFNPHWPTDLLDYAISKGFLSAAWSNLRKNSQKPFDFDLGRLLHTIEIETSKNGMELTVRELTAFFVEPGKLKPPTIRQLGMYNSLHFTASNDTALDGISAVRRYQLTRGLGGSVTPAKLSDRFMKSGPYEGERLHRVVWQNGRFQKPHLGPPLTQGAATFYKFSETPRFELGWVVCRDGKPLLYCYPERHRLIKAGGDTL